MLEVTPINQAQFTPLAEALHRCVDELNSLQQDATFEAIVRQCLSTFPTMELPVEEILKSSLSNLVTENKLSFDKQRQVYTATRTLLTPWDEFERLTLSENFKTEREEDDIELEYKNLHGENLNKCANFEQLIYLNTSADNSKSNTLSTENSFIDEPHFEGKGSNLSILLRRNSSLSNQIEESTVNSELRRANFKRSKSLKLNYKPNGENRGNELLRKDCTCNEIIIKSKDSLVYSISLQYFPSVYRRISLQ